MNNVLTFLSRRIKEPSTWLHFLPVPFLLAANERHRYAYYTNLRVVVFVTACVLAFIYFQKSGRQTMAMAMGIIAFLFNPIWEIHLSRFTWQPIDFWTGIFFLVAPFIPSFSLPSLAAPAAGARNSKGCSIRSRREWGDS
jgi:hypothetical protein